MEPKWKTKYTQTNAKEDIQQYKGFLCYANIQGMYCFGPIDPYYLLVFLKKSFFTHDGLHYSCFMVEQAQKSMFVKNLELALCAGHIVGINFPLGCMVF